MTGGSWPSVFQTAPPQPYSKARMTCSPEFDGGAEASQNGFGDLIPAQSVERSAMVHQLTLRDGSHLAALDGRDPVIVARRQRLSGQQGALDGEGGPLAVGGRVDDLLASVDRVAAGEDLRVGGPQRARLDRDPAVSRRAQPEGRG